MKRILILLMLAFAVWGYVQAAPAVEFREKAFDLGRIPESGGTLSRVYTFRNSGDAPLVITAAETSCSCTKAVISKKPVMPGAEGSITVTYNPRNQHGVFRKAISVYTNVPGQRYIVILTGEVFTE